MCRKICLILVVVLLGGLAACYEAPAGGGPGATPSLVSASSPTASATAVPIPTDTPTATLIPVEPTETPTQTPTPEVISTPSAEQLALAQKDIALADVFSFGGHEWTATIIENGDKIWTREDGKVNLEWVDDIYGGYYQYYMFVTRSAPEEGKRTLEIYSDPRFPIFNIISGSPSAVDTFIGQTVANVMTGSDAQTILRQSGSTLKIILGGIEYYPIGRSSTFKRQDVSYQGPNGEILWQKIWGLREGDQYGIVGAFVDLDNNTLQCASFSGLQYWAEVTDALKQNLVSADIATAATAMETINEARRFDPEESTTPELGVQLKWALILPLFSSEEYNLK